jgi:hypothetical protein
MSELGRLRTGDDRDDAGGWEKLWLYADSLTCAGSELPLTCEARSRYEEQVPQSSTIFLVRLQWLLQRNRARLGVKTLFFMTIKVKRSPVSKIRYINSLLSLPQGQNYLFFFMSPRFSESILRCEYTLKL